MDLVVQPARVEASLWRRFRFENESDCREALFSRYVQLARSIAARLYYRRRIKRNERTDFEHFAFQGLLEAIDRFDPLLSKPFGAYARPRIAGSIAEGVARMSEIDVQISHRHRIEQERLRSLTSSSAGQVGEALPALSNLAVGLALGLMLEGTGLMIAQGADPSPNPYESLEWRDIQTRLGREVVRLPANEAVVIRHHYDNGLRFGQIATLLGLSPGRVSQLHRTALSRLRERIASLIERDQ